MAKKRRPTPKPPRGLRRRVQRQLAVKGALARVRLAVLGDDCWPEGGQCVPPKMADFLPALRNVERVVERYAEPYTRGRRRVTLPWQAEVNKLIPTRRRRDVTPTSILDKLCALEDELHGVIAHVVRVDDADRADCGNVAGNRGCSAGGHLHWRYPADDPKHDADRRHSVSFAKVLRCIRSRLTPST